MSINTLMEKDLKKYLPLMIAGGVALLVVIYYLSSGRSSLDNNMLQLEKASTVQHVEAKEDNTVVVNCKNGESYEIVYQPGQTNYQDLVYDKCGEAGEAGGGVVGEFGTTQQTQ